MITRISQNASKGILVMGILNLTPDSFSDGGRHNAVDGAIARAYEMLEQGADIIDVGAESTRPGALPLNSEDEWCRLEIVLKELCKRNDVPISVDTYRASTALRALELGVDMINDIWGGLFDIDMLPLMANSAAKYVWMHNRPIPVVENIVDVVLAETKLGIMKCLGAGVKPDRLFIDPGIGFAKTWSQNLALLQRLDEFCKLGYPVLLGTSRKGFIGHVLNAEVLDRLEGSLATVSLGVIAGVQAVRVHDVKETVRTCRMLEAVARATSEYA